MQNLTTHELLIRDALVARIASLGDLGAVFSRRRLVSSKQDFITKTTTLVAEKKQSRYCLLEFSGFEDSEEEGCEDDPAVVLEYSLHVAFQFLDSYGELGLQNSFDDFVAFVFAIRESFLADPYPLGGLYDNTQLKPLIQTTDILTEVDPLTDIESTFGDFSVLIEVN